jgi:hypothetical protein
MGPTSGYRYTNGNNTACMRAYHAVAHSTERARKPELWLTETNSVYRDEPKGSNAFLDLYWYATSLGQYANAGLAVHNYFTLVQSNLAMLGCGSAVGTCAESMLRPYPTYFFAVLHKRLVGTHVLAVTTLPVSDGGDEIVPLVFGHCARPKLSGGIGAAAGGLVLVYVNPSPAAIAVDVSGPVEARNVASPPKATPAFTLASSALISMGRSEQYSLTAANGSVNSSSVLLNGILLALTMPDRRLPEMNPAEHSATDRLLMPGSSVGFILFPDANITACF